MFGSDPSYLRHIPNSEYRKRRAYWRLVRKASGLDTESKDGVTVERTGFELESNATVIGE